MESKQSLWTFSFQGHKENGVQIALVKVFHFLDFYPSKMTADIEKYGETMV